MIKHATPERVAFPVEALAQFMQVLEKKEMRMHSVLMMRGEEIFFEKYWAPFTAQTPHRMYSVTKSFVAIAIGFLCQEGKLSLDDPIVRFFSDKLPESVPPLLQKQTVRHMLMMSTCFSGMNWFQPGVVDRTAFYFSHQPVKPAGALFDYDSTGSYILGALVERLSGMPLLEYLKSRVLNRLGGFESAHMLKTPDGTAWGDSALICTPRAVAAFARFVMNLGAWEGEQILSREFLQAATACQTTNDFTGHNAHDAWGYGYQIWKTEQNGFAFNGMGCQFAICLPEKDFIFVCTGDNQINREQAGATIFGAVFDILVPALSGQSTQAESFDLDQPLSLRVAHGAAASPFAAAVQGKIYLCEDNPMGITRFSLEFGEDGAACFHYWNAQGEQRLEFGMQRNLYGKFPQRGYSDEYGNVHELTDFRYDCAASAGWIEPQKLQLQVQIIDRYFGGLTITFGFVDETLVGVRMVKAAEDFLDEYEGWMTGHLSGD